MPNFQTINTRLSITYTQFCDWFKTFEPKDALSRVTSLNWHLYDDNYRDNTRLALLAMARAIAIAHKGTIQGSQQFSDSDLGIGVERFFGISDNPFNRADPLCKQRLQIASSFEAFSIQDHSGEKAIYRYFILYSYPSTKAMRHFDLKSYLEMEFNRFAEVWLMLFGMAHTSFGGFAVPIRMKGWRLLLHYKLHGITNETIELFIRRHATTIEELANFETSVNQGGAPNKYDPNPLLTKPILQLEKDFYVIPSPESYLNIIGNGIYYKAFTGRPKGKILGDEFELYVANQFSLIEDLAIEQVKKVDGDKRADWILLFEDFTLVVEVKIGRLTVNGRAGGSELVTETQRFLGKAVEQINATASAMSLEREEFHYVPTSKPLYGLVILLEPYYLANQVGLSIITDRPAIPTAVISALELETLCSIKDNLESGKVIRKYIDDSHAVPQIFAEWAIRNNFSNNGNDLISLAEKAVPFGPFKGSEKYFASRKLRKYIREKPWYEGG